MGCLAFQCTREEVWPVATDLVLRGAPCTAEGVGAYPSKVVPLVGVVLPQEGMNDEGVHEVRMGEGGCGPNPRVFPLGEALSHETKEVHVEGYHHRTACDDLLVYGLETVDGLMALCHASSLPLPLP